MLDEDHRPVEPGSGKKGLLARSGRIPLGYYRDEEKTARTFVHDPDGKRWVIPGDFATVEADGTITLFGRGSVSINSGGEKIFPEEVEAALEEPPRGVRRHRRRRARRALRPAGGRRRRPPGGPRPRRWRSWPSTPARKIAGYKVPRELHLVDAVTRSPSGKADYRWAKAVATGEA